MSDDGYIFKFSRGDHVYCRTVSSFNGRVMGYIQDFNNQWLCCVQAYESKFMVDQNILTLVPKQTELKHSK